MADTREALKELFTSGFIQEVEYKRRLAACNSANSPSSVIKKEHKVPQAAAVVPLPSATRMVFVQPTSNVFKKFLWTSSLVLCPPPEYWASIVDMKKNHMNQRIKRPPYPHITLLAPFVRYSRFEDARRILFQRLAQISPFTIQINEIKMFDNRTSFTLYLEPVISPPSAMMDLYRICKSSFPQCAEKDFVPHIGIGYFKKRHEAMKYFKQYQKDWQPISYTQQEVYMMSRTGQDSPFLVRKVVQLGGEERTPLIAPTLE